MLQKTHSGRRFFHSIAQLTSLSAARSCRQLGYVVVRQALRACGRQERGAPLLAFGQSRGNALFARGELGEASDVGRHQRLALFIENAEQLGLNTRQLIEQRADLSFEVERRRVGGKLRRWHGEGSGFGVQGSEVRGQGSEVRGRGSEQSPLTTHQSPNTGDASTAFWPSSGD